MTLLSMSQVAELAGFSPAAVSNWRKRFDDFPRPAGESSDGRDLFSLDDIERWLSAHDRLPEEIETARFTFEASDALRETASANDVPEILCAILALRIAASRDSDDDANRSYEGALDALPPETREAFSLLDEHEDAARRIYAMAAHLTPVSAATIFEFLLTRRDRFSGLRSSDALVTFMAALAGTQPAPGARVFDPAAGEGGFLWAVHRELGGRIGLYGQELNLSAWRLAVQRLLVHGISGQIWRGDSLNYDGFPQLRADIVVCDPPYSQRGGSSLPPGDERWLLGFPGGTSLDLAWLQHALYHVAPGGHAYVVTPAGPLFRKGREADVRRELLRRDFVEAVFGLPPRMALHTQIPLAVWVLRRPYPGDQPAGQVLIVDLGNEPLNAGDDAAAAARQAADLLSAWRAQGQVPEDQRSIAAAVDVLDLVAGDAELTPSRWLATTVRPESIAEAWNRYQQGWAAVAALKAQLADAPAPAPLTPEETRWVRVADLVVDGQVELTRPARIEPGDERPAGARVWRAKDLASNDDSDPVFVDPPRGPGAKRLTQPGDVLVSTIGTTIRTRVDEAGGNLVTGSVNCLRLVGNWIDPHVAAEFLKAPRNERFIRGTTVPRLDVRACELPVMTRGQQDQVREALSALNTHQTLADELHRRIAAMRKTLLDVAVSDNLPDDGHNPDQATNRNLER